MGILPCFWELKYIIFTSIVKETNNSLPSSLQFVMKHIFIFLSLLNFFISGKWLHISLSVLFFLKNITRIRHTPEFWLTLEHLQKDVKKLMLKQCIGAYAKNFIFLKTYLLQQNANNYLPIFQNRPRGGLRARKRKSEGLGRCTGCQYMRLGLLFFGLPKRLGGW